jgi:hypothetical protein
MSLIESSACLYIQNWTVTVCASGTEKVVVVSLAIWISIAFEEVSRAKLLIAVIASEMLWMPSLAQSGDHLTHDGFVASVAATFLHSVHTLT